MERKIVFLDIDGVLQPCHSQKRFKLEESDLPKFYKHVNEDFGINYNIYKWYDVAAVYYDWDKTAVSLLRMLLNVTGSQIVLSSDWRGGGFQRMKDFFTIYGLQDFFIDMTALKVDENFAEELKAQYKKVKGKDAFMDSRAIEILEWLHRNPDVKRWVAIDDMKLYGIDANFVCTKDAAFCDEDAVKCFKILTKRKK